MCCICVVAAKRQSVEAEEIRDVLAGESTVSARERERERVSFSPHSYHIQTPSPPIETAAAETL